MGQMGYASILLVAKPHGTIWEIQVEPGVY
jgi:hypothetical protein